MIMMMIEYIWSDLNMKSNSKSHDGRSFTRTLRNALHYFGEVPHTEIESLGDWKSSGLAMKNDWRKHNNIKIAITTTITNHK